jgi:hypothetical protein
MALEGEIKELQRRLAQVDLLSGPLRNDDSGFIEFLVLKLQSVKIKMYQEQGHSTPHIHIDYGPERHVASYAIQTGERLAGTLPRKYEREVTSWLEENCEPLLAIWNTTQAGKDPQPLVLEIRGNGNNA